VGGGIEKVMEGIQKVYGRYIEGNINKSRGKSM